MMIMKEGCRINNNYKNSSLLLLMLMLLLPGCIHAQTMRWAVKPTSAHLENYGSLVKVNKGGKYGLINRQNQEIIPAEYDVITSFRDGYALAMNYRGHNLKIEGVIAEGSYDFQTPSEDVYATDYQWFSEGLMPVVSPTGSYGYMDPSGDLYIPCQFEEAHPFSEGLASVTINEQAFYITRRMDYLPVEAGYGDLVFASTFSGGEAVVYSRNMKGYVINRQGRTVRSYKVKADDVEVNDYDYSIGDVTKNLQQQTMNLPKDERYSVYQENGLFGYKCGDKVILPAQLDMAEPVRGGFANVQMKGQNGILEVVDGDISTVWKNTSINVNSDGVSSGSLQLLLPEGLKDAAIRLHLGDGQGHDLALQNLSEEGTEGTLRDYSFTFRPKEEPKSSGKSNGDLEVWVDNLLMAKDNCDLTYNVVTAPVVVRKPAALSISKPQPKNKRANPKGEFFVNVAVTNTGDEPGDVQVALTVNGKKVGTRKVSVNGRGTRNYSFPVTVKRPFFGKTKASTGNGQKEKENDIYYQPFME